MAKELVIVESPAKAKTLGGILGRRYSIKASVGHVRDLPQKRLGVDVKNGFIPQYVVPAAKKTIVKEIKEAAGKATAIYLATDPDREGEAISWHLITAAKLQQKPIHRVIFHEITEGAIKDAFRHPQQIDMDLVNAQQTRRILDRLVGYKISPLLWRNIKRGLSAGRVQSVALRMIVEREREIQNFIPQEYWTIEVELAKMEKRAASFKAKLAGIKDKRKKLDIHRQEEVEPIVHQLKEATYLVDQVRKKRISRQPTPPFITSTLQQEAWRKLHFTAQRTMSIAQQLYEGLPIGEDGVVGLITYMRTDSTRVAASAIEETRNYIAKKYGTEFLPTHPRSFTKKAKGAQEAHEAVRPTRAEREPSLIRPYLTPDQAKLYELIWKRMVASQMAAALFDTIAVDIEAKEPQEGKTYTLKATGSVMYFSGFLTLYSEGKDELESEEEGKVRLPSLAKDEELRLLDLSPQQHFTQPPPQYNEATLVKTLEERGIGRPSTYASIVSTLRRRGYVERKEGRFRPLELGSVVNDVLVEHFPRIVDIGFTAQIEEKLDEIARGERGSTETIEEFYPPFEETLQKASIAIVKIKEPDQPTDEICPQCGKAMVIRMGRYGKFLACSGYPKCKTTRSLEDKENKVARKGNKGYKSKVATRGKKRKSVAIGTRNKVDRKDVVKAE